MHGAEVIPDEAVEAAAKRLAQFAGLDQWPLCAHQARAALEAAAPHLMAQALDEASEQLEYGNPIGDWLHDRAEAYRAAGEGE